MVCTPSSNTINIPTPGPGPSIPGLGLPFSSSKLDLDIKIPSGIPEDILALLQQLFALFPAGIKFIPNADGAMKDVYDAISSILAQIAPFLGWYKFIQALMNLILCIINVICALLNPFALGGAISNLFSNCLPAFLSMFPWFALILMILAIILLLIALIEYIVAMIIVFIEQIIANLLVFARAVQVADAQAILAAVNKLAYLLCMIEQLMALLVSLQALIAIIKPLMGMAGIPTCSSSDSCCNQEVCPGFIANGNISSITGKLIYFSEIQAPSSEFPWSATLTLPGFNTDIRQEQWQMVDAVPGPFNFVDIITPSPENGFIYWPEGADYDGYTNVNQVPYLLDMNITLDPRLWGNPKDLKGPRKFNIRNAVVTQKPTTYPYNWQANGSVNPDGPFDQTGPVSGAVRLTGGKVYEVDPTSKDGYTSYSIGSNQATLNELIHRPSYEGNSVPSVNDGYDFLEVEYLLHYGYPILVKNQLITMMCQPVLAGESAVMNAEFSDLRSALDKAGPVPDIQSAIDAFNAELAKLRANLNADTANAFQNNATDILNNLKSDCMDYYCNGVISIADRFTSTLTLSPSIQFVDSDIAVTMTLFDKTGTQLAVGIKPEIAACIASYLTTTHINTTTGVTFGSMTPFVYDGYGAFVSSLTSNIAGFGELEGFIKQEPFASVINRGNPAIPTSIQDVVLPYEFVDGVSTQNAIRFGVEDIARDGN